MTFQHLISGFDTIECAYYLVPSDRYQLNFADLALQKEILAQSKSKNPAPIKLGSEEYLLASHGTRSGYPYLMQNDAFIVQFGEKNQPNFMVKFLSIALWHFGVQALHQRFLNWADSVGMIQAQPERLSRVDPAFDYLLESIDFDEDSFISLSDKDNKHRNNGIPQTFNYGKGDVGLRVYNKVDEIKEKQDKFWFFDIWNVDHDVWRIEWQARKKLLRKMGIITFADLQERQGDLFRYLVKQHTTLRIKGNDSNRSRWEMHPLWLDLIERVNAIEGLGIVRELNKQKLLDQTLTHIGISVYGYLKRVAAIDALQSGDDKAYLDESFVRLQKVIDDIHDPLSWQQDVKRRINEMRLGDGKF